METLDFRTDGFRWWVETDGMKANSFTCRDFADFVKEFCCEFFSGCVEIGIIWNLVKKHDSPRSVACKYAYLH